MNQSFQDALNLYFGGRRYTRFQRFFIKLRLLFKSQEYRERRERVLLIEAKHRSKRLFQTGFSKRSSFLDHIPKNSGWSGGYFPVPMSYDKVEETNNSP